MRTKVPLALVILAFLLLVGCSRSQQQAAPSSAAKAEPPVDEATIEAARQLAADFFGVSTSDVKLAPEEYRFVQGPDRPTGIVFEVPGTEKAQCTVTIKQDDGRELYVSSAAWFPPPEKIQPQAAIAGQLSKEEAVKLAKDFVAEHRFDLKAMQLPEEPTSVNVRQEKVTVTWEGEGGRKIEVEVARFARRIVGFQRVE